MAKSPFCRGERLRLPRGDVNYQLQGRLKDLQQMRYRQWIDASGND